MPVRALHDEAHADDKVAFWLCRRPTCVDVLAALDGTYCAFCEDS